MSLNCVNVWKYTENSHIIGEIYTNMLLNPQILMIHSFLFPKFSVILATAIINDFQNNTRDPCHASLEGKNTKEYRAIDLLDFESYLAQESVLTVALIECQEKVFANAIVTFFCFKTDNKRLQPELKSDEIRMQSVPHIIQHLLYINESSVSPWLTTD